MFNDNSNLFKLYEIRHYTELACIPDFHSFKLLKISRTPAFGIKNLTLGNDKSIGSFYLVNFTLKPIHVVFMLYTQFFADLVINDKLKNKNVLTFLNSIKYDKYFYIQNYQHLIPKLYILHRKVYKSDENQVFLQSLSSRIHLKKTLKSVYCIISIWGFTFPI
jgi:hypothetical protein